MAHEPPVRPSKISRYRILNRLGSGGMGDVYAALDETLHRRVALKAIQADSRLSLESQERFLREARILSQLDHPNICRAYDYIQDEDSDWLVMELIEGFSLGDTLKRAPMAASAAIPIAEQIAAVLVVTHAAGIVHRDLKPGNVMITSAGDAKVLDFGIARSDEPRTQGSAPAHHTEVSAADPDDDEATRAVEPPVTGDDPDETRFQTRHDVSIGTLPYMSPEQARGETVTSASDMFSFGLLLQETLTGHRAYPHGLDRLILLNRAQRGEVDPPTGPSDLVQLIRRLTSLAPSQRPTAVEAVERLGWIRDRPKRRLRRATAAAAVLVVVLASVKYTVDLQRERTVAVAAEADSNRRRGQAEDLIGFMLGDLRSKLQEAGRLDLLEAVGGQAMDYFASVPAESLTGEELSRRAQAIYQIGAVRQQQGDLEAARAAYDESLAVAKQVVARDPSNAEWQLRLATAHFYAADVRRRENDLTGAMREFVAYRDIALALSERDPDNLTWALEVSYAHGGVASVQELQGDLAGARQGLELALAVKKQIAARDPRVAARQRDLATAHNRLGVVLDKQGETAAARDHYQADLAIRRALVANDPKDQSIKRQLVVALDAVAASRENAGDLEAATVLYLEGFDVIAQLAAGDPSNANWQRDLAVVERRLGDVLSATGHAMEALGRYQHARTLLTPIAAAAPTDVARQRDLAKVEIGLGRVQYTRGNIAAARQSATDVERLLRALFVKNPDDDTTLLLAEGALLGADCAQRAGDARTARALRESALALTRGLAGGRSKRLRADEARALLALGRVDEARPIVAELSRLGYRHAVLVEAWRTYGTGPIGGR